MLGASALFALTGVCVKYASAQHSAGEIVMYRSCIGLLLMTAALRLRGITVRSPVPGMHVWRSVIGTTGLCLWFYAIGQLPLATAMTLNYMSSVWVGLFLVVSAVFTRRGPKNIDRALLAAIGVGFAGVALVLQPTFNREQWWHGLAGLLSGMAAALAYLQVSALGRVGEPSERVVFYFSICGCVAGAALCAMGAGPQPLTLSSAGWLLAIGLLATVAQWLMTKAYAHGATLGIATLQYLGIVYAALLGVYLFHDPVGAAAVVGMVLIIGAGVAATLFGERAPKQA